MVVLVQKNRGDRQKWKGWRITGFFVKNCVYIIKNASGLVLLALNCWLTAEFLAGDFSFFSFILGVKCGGTSWRVLLCFSAPINSPHCRQDHRLLSWVYCTTLFTSDLTDILYLYSCIVSGPVSNIHEGSFGIEMVKKIHICLSSVILHAASRLKL